MRIVSLCPSITESLIAFGLRDELVGVTRYCIHPAEAVKGLVRVGGTKNPDLALIRTLAPDVVFLNAEENRREDAEAIAAEFPIDVSLPRRAAEVPDMLRQLGRRTGRTSEAEHWAALIDAALAQLSPVPEPVRVAYLIWKDPFMTIGDETYIADLLKLGGGVNVLGGRGKDYPTVSEDEIIESQPALLLLPDEPFHFREPDRLFWVERLPQASVRLVSGDDFSWHGVRTLRGLQAVQALQPARTAA
ncbi:MAG: helical backbone metal receptor [Thermoanaerobaculia bacterium]